MAYRVLSVVAALAALTACSLGPAIYTLQSPQHLRPGLNGYYYLPRTVLKIDIAQGQASAGSPRTGIVTGGPGLSVSAAQVVADPPAPKEQPGKDKDPKGKDATAPKVAAPAVVENFTMTKIVEPDPRGRLYYHFEPNVNSDDVIQVDTTEEGLLTEVSSTNTDRTADILLAGAQLLFTIATHGAAVPSGILTSEAAERVLPPISITFDPSDEAVATTAREALLVRGYCVLVGAVEIKRGPELCVDGGIIKQRTLFSAFPTIDLNYAAENPGIYYRQPVPTKIEVHKLQTGRWELTWAGTQNFFEKRELYQVLIDRAAFVKKQTTVKFTNGSLTTVKLDKPSEAAAAALLPVKVLRIIFAIPLAGLQQETAMLDAQTKLTQAQSSLINAQTQLMKLQVQQSGKSLVATAAGN